MKVYVTQYGKGIFRGNEIGTNRLLIDITEPNEKGKRWIKVHNGDSLGVFDDFECKQLLFV